MHPDSNADTSIRWVRISLSGEVGSNNRKSEKVANVSTALESRLCVVKKKSEKE